MASMTQEFMEKMIEEEIRREITSRLEDVIDEAKIRIIREVHNSVDTIALRVASAYSVEDQGTRVVISVKKDLD